MSGAQLSIAPQLQIIIPHSTTRKQFPHLQNPLIQRVSSKDFIYENLRNGHPVTSHLSTDPFTQSIRHNGTITNRVLTQQKQQSAPFTTILNCRHLSNRKSSLNRRTPYASRTDIFPYSSNGALSSVLPPILFTGIRSGLNAMERFTSLYRFADRVCSDLSTASWILASTP